MLSKLLKLLKKDYQTLNKIEVSKANLIHNYKYLSSLNKGIRIAPVIKSNGYGHGIVEVAKILDPLNPPFFCVDSLFEAYQLQKSGIKIPILITGYTNPENLKVKKLPFSFAVYTKDLLEAIAKYQPQAGVHIFVDTGMRREGVTLEDVKKSGVRVKGLMSHLASTNGKNDPLFNLQIKQFKKALKIVKEYKISPRWIHIAASGGLINKETNEIISQISNLSRTGISLYGLGDDKNLKPTLKLITHLGQIKILRRGETSGYDGAFSTKKDLNIGILPIGYNDGVDRRLSNKGMVIINRVICPIIGRVSMNITIVDISKLENPQIGMEVLVYSDNPSDPNSMQNCAKICKTITYDLLVNLDSSIKRIII